MELCHDDPQCVRVRLPVPSGTPAVSLLCISDTHDQQAYIPHALPAADILIHAGDFSCRGSRDEILAFKRWTDQLLAEGTVREVVFVAGNHDCALELGARIPAAKQAQQRLKAELVERPGVHYLQDDGCVLACGLRLYGSPWTIRCGRDWAFQSLDTDAPEHGVALGDKFGAIPEGVDVLVTHQPPHGIGDGDTHGRVGSVMLRRRVGEVRPLVHVFGHIHAGHGVTEHGGTCFVNAAVCDDEYQPVQKPILVQLVPAAIEEP